MRCLSCLREMPDSWSSRHSLCWKCSRFPSKRAALEWDAQEQKNNVDCESAEPISPS